MKLLTDSLELDLSQHTIQKYVRTSSKEKTFLQTLFFFSKTAFIEPPTATPTSTDDSLHLSGSVVLSVKLSSSIL